MLTESQIEFRKTRLGSSDWGKILSGDHGGLNSVLRDKIYGSQLERNLRMELGDIAEEEIGLWGMDQVGGFSDYRQQVQVEDKECPLIGAHIDFLGCKTVGDVDEEIIFECKLVFPENAWQWRDCPPKYPVAQLQCQMMCLNAPYGYIAAWIIDGNPEKRLYRVEADRSEWETMRRATPVLFERYINPGVMPDGVYDMYRTEPGMMYPVLVKQKRSGEIVLPKDMTVVAKRLEQARASNSLTDAVIANAKDIILKSIGPFALGMLPGGRAIFVWNDARGATKIDVLEKHEIAKAREKMEKGIVENGEDGIS